MDRFRAGTGRDAMEAIAEFVRFVRREQRVSFAGPVRETRTAQGRAFVFDAPMRKFPGAFRVSLAGERSVRIGEGTVNGRAPWLDGREITGRMTDGEEDPRGIPLLSLDGEPVDRRSWICLRVATVEGSLVGEIAPGEDGLTVVHRPALPVGVPYGLDEEGRGLRPVAHLAWDATGNLLGRIRQVLHFDQVYRAPRGEDPRPEWVSGG